MPPRVMVSDRLVTVFGGSGFIGRHVVRDLATHGWQIRNACRRPDLAGHLQPLGSAGQIHSVQANLRNEASVRAAVQGADVVINLAAVMYESGRQRFDEIHVNGARRVAEAARDAGADVLVQMSALGADANSPSAYGRSRARGEEAARTAFPDAIIFRPSLVFGPEDQFFNRFGSLARFTPALPLIGGGTTRFQPVFAGDVASAIAKAADGEARPGTVYELGGPETRTLRQLFEYILEITGRKRFLVPLPFPIAGLMAQFLELLPSPLLTADQVKLLRTDNVVSEEARKEGRVFESLGIRPMALEAIVPSYLYRFRKAGQFTDISNVIR